MAKKTTKKPNLPQQTLERARRELAGVDTSATEASADVASRAAARSTSIAATPSRRNVGTAVSIDELREEYSYVIADLRSMGILAAILFVALVIAALVLV